MLTKFAVLFASLSSLWEAPTLANPNQIIAPLKLIRLEYFEYNQENYVKVIGHFEAINPLNQDLCFMKDVFVNELSPYVQIDHRKKMEDTPNPPIASGETKVRPQGSLKISRVVSYIRPNRSENLRIIVHSWSCHGKESVLFRSDRFRVKN